jgi:hypothetical protein
VPEVHNFPNAVSATGDSARRASTARLCSDSDDKVGLAKDGFSMNDAVDSTSRRPLLAVSGVKECATKKSGRTRRASVYNCAS